MFFFFSFSSGCVDAHTQLYTTPGKRRQQTPLICVDSDSLSFLSLGLSAGLFSKNTAGNMKNESCHCWTHSLPLSPSLSQTHTRLNWQGRGSAAQKRLSKHCPRQSRIAHTHRQTQRAVSDAGISHPPGKYERLVTLYRLAWSSNATLILSYIMNTCELTGCEY